MVRRPRYEVTSAMLARRRARCLGLSCSIGFKKIARAARGPDPGWGADRKPEHPVDRKLGPWIGNRRTPRIGNRKLPTDRKPKTDPWIGNWVLGSETASHLGSETRNGPPDQKPETTPGSETGGVDQKPKLTRGSETGGLDRKPGGPGSETGGPWIRNRGNVDRKLGPETLVKPPLRPPLPSPLNPNLIDNQDSKQQTCARRLHHLLHQQKWLMRSRTRLWWTRHGPS